MIEEVGQRLVGRRHDAECCRNMDAAAELSIERPRMQLVHLLVLSRGLLGTLNISGLTSMQLFCIGSDVVIVFVTANAAWLDLLCGHGVPSVAHGKVLVRSDSELSLAGVGCARYNGECANRVESSHRQHVWYLVWVWDQESLNQLHAHATPSDEDILAAIAQSERDREPVSLRPRGARLEGKRCVAGTRFPAATNSCALGFVTSGTTPPAAGGYTERNRWTATIVSTTPGPVAAP